jgi:hypothetical protein
MKTISKFIVLFFFLFVLCLSINAQNKQESYYFNIAQSFISRNVSEYTVLTIPEIIFNNSTPVAYVYHLSPRGFVVITVDQNLFPVYAYSFENNVSMDNMNWNEWTALVRKDIAARSVSAMFSGTDEKAKISESWNSLLTGASDKKLSQQWPPSGSTSTGGWLETNWTQSAPYNNMCPMDTNAGNRSIAGCPSVAMAQILNFHKEINGTRFNNSDDYYHNYGAGNQYWIDNDSATFDFPGFGTLNLYLDSLEQFYFVKTEPPDHLKAALVFACGVAATQVYTAAGSGTFGIDQAADAYQRFGFTTSHLVYPADTGLNKKLAENMKTGHPAHLGVVNAGSTAGHNVVVDGYNTDDFYHFNFGWGGSNNGWYTMPPAAMPYSLNYIEGVVLDINVDTSSASVSNYMMPAEINIYPNPTTSVVTIEKKNIQRIEVTDIRGRTVRVSDIKERDATSVDISDMPNGICLIKVITEEGVAVGKVMLAR